MPRKRNKKPTVKSEGLGDTIEKVTKATGIDKIVEKVFPDCRCQKRKEWLNKSFPYVNGQKKCMNEEQYTFFREFKEKYLSESKQVSIPNEQLTKLIELYNSVFQVNVNGCTGCNAGHFVKKLDTVYVEYEKNIKEAK